MIDDEALNVNKPQNKTAVCMNMTKRKSVRGILRAYFFAICLLFLLVVILCSFNFIVLSWYKQAKLQLEAENYKAGLAAGKNLDLSMVIDDLKKENSSIITSSKEAQEKNEAILKIINDIRRQNDELVKKNKELTEDNIALQNSLKMAASVGIKPQNYSQFNGITARGELERGNYIGRFWGTAYTPSKKECGNDKGITNSGEPIIPGVSLAVDGKYWPFGTVFYIKGLGYAVAMDTGSAIKGKNRFDFAVFDQDFANTLGARYWDV